MPPKCPVRETLSGMLFFRKLARQQVTHDMLWHTKFGDQVLEHSQQQGNEPQKHQLCTNPTIKSLTSSSEKPETERERYHIPTLLNLLQSLEQRILVLLLQILQIKNSNVTNHSREREI